MAIAIRACPPIGTNIREGFKRLVTVDHTKVDEDLTDFPVLVPLTSGNFDFSQAMSDGHDLRFSSDDGVALKYERERHSSPNAEYWVKIPSVLSGASTYFVMRFGKPDASDGQNAAGVWDSGYALVVHVNEGSGTTAGDSTSNGKDGTLQGNMAWTTSGKANGGVEGPGDTVSYISFPSDTLGALSALTVEAWINPDTSDTYEAIAGRATSGDASGEWWFRRESNSTIYFVTRTDPSNVRDDLYSAGTATTGWNYVVTRWDGSTGVKNIFINDTKDSNSSTVGSSLPDTGYTLYLARFGNDTTNLFDGKLDEYRISTVARSDAWIKASYHSENGTLLTVEESTRIR